MKKEKNNLGYTMKLHEKAVLPQGFSCTAKNCGIKKTGQDLAIFFTDKPATAAGVFTKNHFPGAPVILGREIIQNASLQAVVINSKISNVGTGEEGINNARRMAQATALEFGIDEKFVIMSSTGIIAKQLPIKIIETGIKGCSKNMSDDPLVGARGIMTTDTYPKALSISVGDAVITIIAKGSGMIEPNMATMLAYIFTDADIETKTLDTMLREAVSVSFNMLSVDTDTSTSDTCLIMANGLVGKVDETKFKEALFYITTEMTKAMARDGEGATKLLIADIKGALNKKEAGLIAKSIINSPLIKTMAYGADPNVGRILMAVGKCFECTIDKKIMDAAINDIVVFEAGSKAVYDEEQLRNLLKGDPVKISIHLHVGEGIATAYGCDLTEGYIKENAAYYSS